MFYTRALNSVRETCGKDRSNYVILFLPFCFYVIFIEDSILNMRIFRKRNSEYWITVLDLRFKLTKLKRKSSIVVFIHAIQNIWVLLFWTLHNLTYSSLYEIFFWGHYWQLLFPLLCSLLAETELVILIFFNWCQYFSVTNLWHVTLWRFRLFMFEFFS